ncbi:MAG: hypothetical protein R3C11_14265 [Planctomycetaceae bacterium]
MSEKVAVQLAGVESRIFEGISNSYRVVLAIGRLLGIPAIATTKGSDTFPLAGLPVEL